MDEKTFNDLLRNVDQMIQTSAPEVAEYLRGYRLGILFHQSGIEEDPEEHFYLRGPHAGNSDRYLGAFARGYCDGCNGALLDD